MQVGMERVGRQGWNRTGNGRRGRRVRAGQAEEYGCQKVIRWWGMCQSTGVSTRGRVPIGFVTYNIRNGRDGGLELVLRRMAQANMNLGICQETKITDGVYTHGSAGYSIVATDAPSR